MIHIQFLRMFFIFSINFFIRLFSFWGSLGTIFCTRTAPAVRISVRSTTLPSIISSTEPTTVFSSIGAYSNFFRLIFCSVRTDLPFLEIYWSGLDSFSDTLSLSPPAIFNETADMSVSASCRSTTENPYSSIFEWSFQSSGALSVTATSVTPSRRAAETRHRPLFFVKPVFIPTASSYIRNRRLWLVSVRRYGGLP